MTASEDDEARLAEVEQKGVREAEGQKRYEAEVEQRKADYEKLWLDQLKGRGDWGYAETLLWIVFRDLRRTATELDYGRDKLCTDSASMVVALVGMMGSKDQASAERNPEAALNVAVTRGSVVGEGLNGVSWEIGRHVDPARSLARFDRVSVVATFPPNVELEEMAGLAPPATAPTPPKSGQVAARARFAAVVADNPGGPPAGWRKVAAIDTLAREFGLADAEALAVRQRVLGEETQEIRARWISPGAPKKSTE